VVEIDSKNRDLTNYRSGRLVAKAYLGGVQVDSIPQRRGYANEQDRWECVCDCGNTIAVAARSLTRRSKPTRSCGCLQKAVASQLASSRSGKPRQDLTGLKIGKLTAIAFGGICPNSPLTSTRRLTWICQCECGNLVTIRASSLTCSRPPKSCGCMRPRPVKTSSLTQNLNIRKPPIVTDFNLWLRNEYDGMKSRCENSEHRYYNLFGGSGVEMRWESFDDFKRWVVSKLGVRTPGTKLVRLDRYGHFEPGNLRWSSQEPIGRSHFPLPS
jgi:hypothetical protein